MISLQSARPIRSSFRARVRVAQKAISPTFLFAFNVDFFAARDPRQSLRMDSGDKSGRVSTGTHSAQSSGRRKVGEKTRPGRFVENSVGYGPTGLRNQDAKVLRYARLIESFSLDRPQRRPNSIPTLFVGSGRSTAQRARDHAPLRFPASHPDSLKASAIPNHRERFSLLAGRSNSSARGVLLDGRRAASPSPVTNRIRLNDNGAWEFVGYNGNSAATSSVKVITTAPCTAPIDSLTKPMTSRGSLTLLRDGLVEVPGQEAARAAPVELLLGQQLRSSGRLEAAKGAIRQTTSSYCSSVLA